MGGGNSISNLYKIGLILLLSTIIFLSTSENFILSQEIDNNTLNDSNNISLDLTNQINEVTNTTNYKHSSWGILIQDQDTGEIIFDKNSQDLMVPGSTTKLFIAAAALENFGPEYRFQTPVYYNGTVDLSGNLKGDIIIVASGDLTMGGRNTPDGRMAFVHPDHSYANALGDAKLTDTDPLTGLNELARQVKASGINKIEGEVIIDDRLYETTMAPTGEYLITPIMINDNLIDLEIIPANPGENATIKVRPPSGLYNVSSQVETISSGEENIVIESEGYNILARGQILENSTPIVRTVTVEDPSSWTRSLFIEALRREGVQVNATLDAENPQELLPNENEFIENQQLASYTSLPFSENIKVMLKLSHNIHADNLVSILAADNDLKTFDEGMQLKGNFVERIGIDRNTLALADGRGGASSDRISPQATNQLLNFMQNQEYFSYYFEALPIMGYDGTLEGAVPTNSSIYGNIYTKTGTAIEEDKLNNRGISLGQSMAGYMVTDSGRKLIFSIFVNNVALEEEADHNLISQDMYEVLEIAYKLL